MKQEAAEYDTFVRILGKGNGASSHFSRLKPQKKPNYIK